MTKNGQPSAGVPGPLLKMFLTNLECLPCKVPGPDEDQPGVDAIFHSGDLSIHVLFPANQVQPVAEALVACAVEAAHPPKGIILPTPSMNVDEISRKAHEQERKMRGE